jgi:2,4-dienoyl-CoA reductase-like NADH-dependent reductase (Old Yellow Enzyme family)
MSEIMARPRFESEAVDPAPLAAPLKFEFSGRTVSNRLLKAAITERMATWHTMDLPRRGIPTKELINVYRRWGEAGFGLMLTGNLMIELDQLESAGNLIIPRGAPFEGERFDAFRDMAAAGKKHGSLFIVQLSHPGRQTYSVCFCHLNSSSSLFLFFLLYSLNPAVRHGLVTMANQICFFNVN